MNRPGTKAFGVIAAAGLGAAALGVQMLHPAASTSSRPRAPINAGQVLINDPQETALLPLSEQLALQPLRTASSLLAPPPILRPATGSGTQADGSSQWTSSSHPPAFNNDLDGSPQNTESVSTCQGGNDVVGTWDDFRNEASFGDITGWGISTNGGRSLANSGYVPGLVVSEGTTSGPVSGSGKEYVPTQGSAVIRATNSCTVYASSLAFESDYAHPYASAVIVARSDASTLAACNTEKSCWPVRKAVVVAPSPSVLFTGEWMAVSPTAPQALVWVGYIQVGFDEYGNQIDSLNVVRCDAGLSHCSKPIVVQSLPGPYAATAGGGGGGLYQFLSSIDLAVTPNDRPFVTWSTESFNYPAATSITVYLASANAAGTAFTSPVTVTQVSAAVGSPFASESVALSAYPVVAISRSGGVQRVHVVYGECRDVADGICEHSETILATSPSGAAGSFTYKAVDPAPAGSDFFPTVTADQSAGTLLVGFWTTRYDAAQHSYDVLIVPVDPQTGAVSPAIRVTPTSIEPDNDPTLGAFSIGSYWELVTSGGTTWAHYTSTQRLQRLLGQGVPVPQQDNVLATCSC